jgi:hypothetical protein
MLKIPCPEVGFEQIAIEALQARFWVASGLATNRAAVMSCTRVAEAILSAMLSS